MLEDSGQGPQQLIQPLMRDGAHQLRLESPEAQCLPKEIEHVAHPYLFDDVIGRDRRADPTL